MHPILFSIPIPGGHLPLGIMVLVLGAVAAAFGVRSYLVERKQAKPDNTTALIAGAIAIACVAGRFLWMNGHPEYVSYELKEIPIYSYGVMLGLSLVVGWYLTLTLAERDGLPKETMANCYVVTAVVAVIGSRVLYILTNLSEFDSFASLFAMRRGGLVAYGGFLGGFVGSYFFLRRHKISILPWADVAVPSLASGLMITRIGCYLFGCDFGRPLSETAPGWLKKLGTFPHWVEGTIDQGEGSPAWVHHTKTLGLSRDATHSLPVHPTQIYESLVGAGLLVLLLYSRRHQKFRGQIFLIFTFAYGVCRYLLEVLRDDAERGSLPPSLPEHVLVPLGLAVFAVAWFIGFSKAIKNPTLQKATQAIAFVPAIAAYIVMRPQSFAASASVEWSTSQVVAITTGFAAAVGFSILWRGALAHPESAMALNLRAPIPAGAPVADEDDDEDDEDDDEDEAPRKAAKKPVKPAAKEPPKEEPKPAKEAAKEPAAEPRRSAKKKVVKKKPAPKKDVEDVDEEAEPEKAAAEDD